MRQYQIDNLIAISASFVIVLTITLLVLRSWRRAFEAQHELRRQLIDKMTPEEVARIVTSAEGSRAVEALTGSGESGAAGATGRGVMLLLIGAGLGVAAAISHLPLVGVAGMMAFAAGVGQIVIAVLMKRERQA
ncbi:MAG TPA: hypothetical protein VH087_14685 [Thermoanaerobaculia bacterium]|jgi:hypothetical protein|nr:hypothetical protein [Thermoanaerobaculia bacterium]